MAAALLLTGAPGARAQEIVVSAAASLGEAFAAVGAAWTEAHPGWRAVLNVGASGALLAQLRQGAPVDVLATADGLTMDRAAQGGLLAAGTRANFARNALVLVVPAGAVRPDSLAALAGSQYRRLAAGSPASVPAGRYAQAVVQQAGLAGALAPRWVYGESVRQVLDYVARGEAQAGFVYRTDARLRPDAVRVALTLATPEPVLYPIAQVARSGHPALARSFIAFVRGSQGQRILARFGFEPP